MHISPNVTAKTFRLTKNEAIPTPFIYPDSASVRTGISNLSRLFIGKKIGIIGLGGTGSYILDLVAKTPVEEIHLFDDDKFCQHNAFRTPGAAALEDVSGNLAKIEYLKNIYSKMHKGIINHLQKVDVSSQETLAALSFVFLSIDNGQSRKEISELLFQVGVPFIDVGMGLDVCSGENGEISGICRVSFGSSNTTDFFRKNVPFSEGKDDIYNTNIQVADLNALNAALAVIRWKKYLGYYHDSSKEVLSSFTVDTNAVGRAPN